MMHDTAWMFASTCDISAGNVKDVDYLKSVDMNAQHSSMND